MKKFPSVPFDFKAEDQTNNLKALVTAALDMRNFEEMGWTYIEELYKASRFAKSISWHKLYKAASLAERTAVPPPVMPIAPAIPAPKPRVRIPHIIDTTALIMEKFGVGREIAAKLLVELNARPELVTAMIMERLDRDVNAVSKGVLETVSK